MREFSTDFVSSGPLYEFDEQAITDPTDLVEINRGLRRQRLRRLARFVIWAAAIAIVVFAVGVLVGRVVS